MILVFTGRGKGKTTAALGQAMRALGQGKKVLMVQFIKSKKWPSGEEKIISKLGPNFKLIKGGLGFVRILRDKLPFKKHQKAAKLTLEKAKKAIFSKKFDLVILDEINVALWLKLIKQKEVLDILKRIPLGVDLILTGRSASKKLMKMADLVTEFREIKHHFQRKIIAKRGIEY